MKLNYLYVVLLFVVLGLVAVLIFPTPYDRVTLYRKSHLYSPALQLLDQMAVQHPEDERVALERARILYLAGRYEKAVELLQEVSAENPHNTEAWRRLALTYRTIQQPRDAIFALEQVVVSAPADSEALYLLDEYYRWFQLSDRAGRNLEALVQHFPDAYDTWNQLANFYLRTGQGREAIRVLNQIVTTFPDSMDARLGLGYVFLFQKDQRALPLFEELHQTYPERREIFDGLTSALIIGDQKEKAIALFQHYYEPRLEPGAYYAGLSELYVYLNEPENAIRALEDKLKIAPAIETRLQLIDIYSMARDYLMAATYARQLVRDQPERVDLWEIYIASLEAAELKTELVEALEHYTARWPHNRAMWLELADAYEWIENYPAELQIAQRLFHEHPDRDDYRERLGRIYYALNDYDKAAAHYAYLLNKHPGSETFLQGLVWAVQNAPSGSQSLAHARQLYQVSGPAQVEPALLLARLYEKKAQFARADRIYAQLRQAHPDSVHLHARIGRSILDGGRREPAQSCFLEVLEKDPGNRVALKGLAEITRDAAPQEALHYLEVLERDDPRDAEIIYQLALVHEALSDSTQMRSYFQRFLDLVLLSERTDIFFLRQKVHALYRIGSVHQALRLVEQLRQQYAHFQPYPQLLQQHPQLLEALNDYAEMLIAQKQYDRALEVLEKVPSIVLPLVAAAEDEQAPWLRSALLRSQVYIARQEWEAAEVELVLLADRRPGNRYILNDLAVVYQRRGHTDQAVEIHRQLLALYPESDLYRRDLAYLLYQEERYAEIVDLLTGGLDEPGTAEAGLLQLLAAAYDRTNRAAMANQLYEVLAEKNPEDVSLLLLLGERYLGQNQPARARSYFQRVQQMQPRNHRALKGLAMSLGATNQVEYRKYLLPILVLDKQDAEVPYLLGESYFAHTPQKAAKFYQEALGRLEEKEELNPYQRRIQVRVLYRLGQRQQAEEILRALLSQNPDDRALENDLAEILIEDEHYEAALRLILPAAGDTRSAWLRIRVYQERGQWSRAAGELAILAERSPTDDLRLDLAAALGRSEEWSRALQIYNEILLVPQHQAAAERAYELRRQQRVQRGAVLGLEFSHIGLTDEGYRGLRPFLRWHINSRTQATVHWTASLYEDDRILARPDFSKRVGEYGLELRYSLYPNWEVRIHGRGYLGHLSTRPNFGLGARYRLGQGGVVEIASSFNEIWTEPVDAVVYSGLFHQGNLSLSLPLSKGWHLQGETAWHSFRLHRKQDFGNERKGTLSLEREIIRLPHGRSFPLRSLSLSAAHERSRFDQKKAFAELFRLPDGTSTTTLNLLVHFLFKHRGLLDLSFFVGRDPERDLGMGQLYGTAAHFHADLRPDLVLYANGFFTSESITQIAGGAYKQARSGLLYYF